MSNNKFQKQKTELYLTYYIEDEIYASTAVKVTRIENWSEPVKLPGAQKPFICVVKIGAEMFPVLDILRTNEVVNLKKLKLISMDYVDGNLAIPVDSVSEIITVKAENIRAIPSIFSNEILASIIKKCIISNGKIIPIIDLEGVNF